MKEKVVGRVNRTRERDCQTVPGEEGPIQFKSESGDTKKEKKRKLGAHHTTACVRHCQYCGAWGETYGGMFIV